MNTFGTANNTSPKPLERMRTLTPVLEDSDREGPLGYYNPNKFQEYKVETSEISAIGSIDNFNPEEHIDKQVSQEDISSLLKPGEWTSFIPNATDVVSKTAEVAKSVVSETADAGFDLINKMTGLNQEPERAEASQDPSKLDPAVAKKQEEANEYSVIKQAEEVIAREQADYRGKELFEKAVMSKKAEIADLANLQGNYRGVLDEKGETSTHLQTAVAQAREKIIKDQQTKQEPLVSTAKVGGQGVNTDQDRINEGSSILSTTGGGGAG